MDGPECHDYIKSIYFQFINIFDVGYYNNLMMIDFIFLQICNASLSIMSMYQVLQNDQKHIEISHQKQDQHLWFKHNKVINTFLRRQLR